MSKKLPTTATPLDGGGRQLRSYRAPLRRSPRFEPQTTSHTALRAPPTATSTNKKANMPTKQQPKTPSSERQRKRPNKNRPPQPGSVDAGARSRRRSPRLASREAKNENDIGSSGGGGRGGKKETAPQTRRSSPKLSSNAGIPAKKDEVFCLGGGEKVVESAEKEGWWNKRRKVETSAEGKVAVGSKHCCGSEDWTEEQELALRNAYLLARPSPHFWKKVSKMVPGKSAQECFNRIHANHATPPQHQPRSRANTTNLSPIGNFTFSDKSVDDMKVKVRRARSSKQKTLIAQKTVRHLLRKHSLADQTQEADYFSVLENSAGALALELPEIRSPGTPNSLCPPGFLLKCNERSSSAHKRLLSRFKTNNTDPSPEVLKRIKNVALHEKYIDHLHCREARRRSCLKVANSLAGGYNKIDNKPQAGVLKAARAALITEAKEAISHFQYVQAKSLDYDDDATTTGNRDADSDSDDDDDDDV